MAKTSIRREEQRHKEGSVAFTVVVLFQGGFFFLLLWRHISWDTSQNQCNSSANGCYVHRACKRAGICFHCTSGSFSPAPTLNGLSFCRSWEVFAQPEICAANQSYSIDTVGAHFWLKSWQNIFWFCQHDRPQLINKHQVLKFRDETSSITRLKLSSFLFIFSYTSECV